MKFRIWIALFCLVTLATTGCSKQAEEPKKETSSIAPESSADESEESSKENSEENSKVEASNDFNDGTTPATFKELSFLVPKKWEYDGSSADGGSEIYYPKHGIFFYTAQESIPGINSDVGRNAFIESFGQGIGQFKQGEVIDYKVSGIEGFRFTFTGNISNTDLYGDTVVFNTPNYCYALVMGTYGDNGSLYEKDYQSILDSIVVTEEKAEESSEESAQEESSEKESTKKEEEQPSEDTTVSKEYQNALKKAQSYSDNMYMSKQGIYDQLTSEYGENFEEDAAQYAIDHLEADFKYNALKNAENYNEFSHMSKKGLFDQLTSEYGEQFTEEEAQYAVDNIKADFKENALLTAKDYQDNMGMSKAEIYDQLVSEYGEQFTEEEAQYAIDHLED